MREWCREANTPCVCVCVLSSRTPAPPANARRCSEACARRSASKLHHPCRFIYCRGVPPGASPAVLTTGVGLPHYQYPYPAAACNINNIVLRNSGRFACIHGATPNRGASPSLLVGSGLFSPRASWARARGRVKKYKKRTELFGSHLRSGSWRGRLL